MTLYDQADKNIRKTWFLITGFLVFVIALGFLFSYIWDSPSILVFAFVLSLGMSIASYWKSDQIVLSMTKAIPIEKKDNPELYRIVENLSITAGLPMPRIYLIDSSQPNAFTTGRNSEKAIIVVTSGLLKKLDRVELEGVIAHELAHIGNRDMLLGTVVVVLVGIIVLLSRIFLRVSLFGGDRKSRDDDNGAGGLLIVLGIVAAILAPLAAGVIKSSISKKREFLADSSGALLTRYPEGLARALEKISEDDNELKVADPSVAHLFISSPFKEKSASSMDGKKKGNWFNNLFLTHPPIEERIKALRDLTI